jgi:integrase
VRELSKADVLKVLDGAVNAGTPSAANHALAAVRKLFSWAVERGLVTANPCSGISRPAPAEKRERVLSMAELGAVWSATETASVPFSQIVRLLMLTAQRRGEVVGMQWSELNLDAHTWSIPAKRTKSNRAQIVPLSQPVMLVISEIPRINEDLVFPARGNGGTTTSGFSKMKRALDECCQVVGWTLHDLRRSAATHMASFGVAPHVIERVLNHTTGTLGGVAGIYNRFQYLPEMRIALELWGEQVAKMSARR